MHTQQNDIYTNSIMYLRLYLTNYYFIFIGLINAKIGFFSAFCSRPLRDYLIIF